MADSHRSALRPRGRPRGRHARLVARSMFYARISCCDGPAATCLGRSSSAVEPCDKWRASGLAGANPRGAWWSFDRTLSIVLSGTPGAFEWWVYEGSARPRHAPSPRAPPSRSTSSRSRSGRSGAIPMPWSPRAMSNSCVSARLLAQARKRVSRGGFFVSTRRHRTRNRTRRSSRWENILESNVPRTVWIKWLKNIFQTH